MPDLPSAIYVPVATALVGAVGVMAAAVRRLYGDNNALRKEYEVLLDRAVVAMERATAATVANTEGLKAVRDETLALYRALVRASATSPSRKREQ